jgi:hypothetical protein
MTPNIGIIKWNHINTFRTKHDSISSKLIAKQCILWLLFIIKWSKLGSYLHNTNIWHHYWSNFGHLTPGPGVTIYMFNPYCVAIHFEEISSCFVLNVFLWLFCIIKLSKLGGYLHNIHIWHNFWSKFGYFLKILKKSWEKCSQNLSFSPKFVFFSDEQFFLKSSDN